MSQLTRLTLGSISYLTNRGANGHLANGPESVIIIHRYSELWVFTHIIRKQDQKGIGFNEKHACVTTTYIGRQVSHYSLVYTRFCGILVQPRQVSRGIAFSKRDKQVAKTNIR